MATIITKNSSTASSVPAAGSLQQGELAVNVTDKKLYTKDSSAAVVKLVGSLGNQEASAVAITGGTINGTAIGGTSTSTGAFTTVSASGGFTGNLTGNASTVTNGVYTTGSYADPTWITSLAGSKITGNISGNATNVTGTVAIANGGTGLTALGTGVQTALGQTVTGSGGIVLANSPALVTPNLGTPSAATLTNATGLPVSTGISGLGTNVATALGVSVGSVGSVVVNGGVLGTPSSGTLTNATGLPLSTGVTGTLAVANGGTGQTTANAAFNALAPSQTSNAGRYLKTDGTNTSWDLLDISTADITGTLPVANGGTGLTSFTANGVVYASSTSALTTGSALTFDGTNLKTNNLLSTSNLVVSVDNASNSMYVGGGSFSPAELNLESVSSTNWKVGGTERMRLTSTGLGIGTSSPATKLHISGSTTPNLRFEQTNSSVVHQFQAASGNFFLNIDATNAIGGSTFLIQQAGSTVATLSSTGNLGLGVTPSAWSLGKALQIGASGAAALLGYNNSFYLTANAYYDGGWKYTATAAAGRYQLESGIHSWSIAPSGTAGNAISFTQAMTLDASGNLLVGGTTNTSMATVQISVGSTSTASSALQFLSTTSGSNGIYFGDGTSSTDRYRGYLEYNHASDFMVLATAATERARITSGGSFNIGTTSLGGDNLLNINNSSSTGYGISVYVNNDSSTTYRYFEGYSTSASTQRIVIYTNGDVRNSNNSYGALSDAKLKQDIVDAGSQWNDIKALRVRKYRFRDQPDSALHIGLIAQEAETVSPGLITEHQDEKRNENGSIELLDTTTKSLKYSVLYMKAIKALQEAMARIEQLEAKVAALEAK